MPSDSAAEVPAADARLVAEELGEGQELRRMEAGDWQWLAPHRWRILSAAYIGDEHFAALLDLARRCREQREELERLRAEVATASGWRCPNASRAADSFTAEEVTYLRPAAEVLALIDGNAFFGTVRDEAGEDAWFRPYLPEAHELVERNGGMAGWAGEASFVRLAAENERLRARVAALEPKCANCGGRVPDDACGLAPVLLCEPCIECLSHV